MEDQHTGRLPRRAVVLGLAGLAAVTAAGGGVVAWFEHAKGSSAQVAHPQPTGVGC